MADDKSSASKVGVPELSVHRDDMEPPQADLESSETTQEGSNGTRSSRLSVIKNNAFVRRCWSIISWTPPRCRWDPDNPPKFTMALNLLFGFVSLFNQ